MISDEITKLDKGLEERGIPKDSYFEVEFKDGSKRTEHDTSWFLMSEKKIVGFFGAQKSVTLCVLPVKRLTVYHEGLSASVDVPEGCKAYQAIRAETLFLPQNERQYRAIGRVLGVVRDGEIVEELYIDGLQNRVFGMRK